MPSALLGTRTDPTQGGRAHTSNVAAPLNFLNNRLKMPSNAPAQSACQWNVRPNDSRPLYAGRTCGGKTGNAQGASSPGEDQAAVVSLRESFLLGAIWKEYLGVCVS